MKTKIGNICKVVSGGDKPDLVSEYKTIDCNIPIFGNALDNEGLYGYTNFSIINEPAVTIAARGSNCGVSFYRDEPYVPIVRLLSLIPNKDIVNPRYFYYVIKNRKFKSSGSGQPQITIPQIVDCKVDIIDEIKIQNKIADILTKIDTKISLNNKICNEIDKLAKALYDYWFVQFDFPDENARPYKSSNGKMIYNEKLKRNIPYNWAVDSVKSCITHINTGLNPRDNFILNNGNIKYITVKNLTTRGSIDFSNCDTIDEVAQKIVHKRSDISKGDILFASIAPLGRCYLIQEEPKTWDINESVFSIRPQSTIPSEYLYMFLMSETFVKKAENSSTGSVFAGIRIKTLEDMPLVIPDNNILQLFKEKMSKIFQQKYIMECENQKLIEIRDFLLPMLMNGQVTVLDSDEDDLSEDKIIEKSLEFWQTHGKMDIDQFARENGILVYKDNEQRKGTVSYNKEKDLYEIAVKDPRDNFTIAHEIGHILKHKKELKNGTLGRKSEESGSKLMEYEADNLAAEILMPEEYVLKYMQDENKTDKEFLDEKFIKECAKHFDVNPPAMNIRLKNLGFKVPYLK